MPADHGCLGPRQLLSLTDELGSFRWPEHHEFYTLWDFFTPAFNCPHETERVGILGDGGKWVCGLSKIDPKPDCTIYSFGERHNERSETSLCGSLTVLPPIGINDESSFEAALLEKTQYCQVWGYDFSVEDVCQPALHSSPLCCAWLNGSVWLLVRPRSAEHTLPEIALSLLSVGLIGRGRSHSQPANVHPPESYEDER